VKAIPYLILAAAFFLPWTVGLTVSSVRTKKKDKVLLYAVLCALSVLVIVGALVFSFLSQK